LEAGYGNLLKVEKVIECVHGCGSDKLIHRALKDFSNENCRLSALRLTLHT